MHGDVNKSCTEKGRMLPGPPLVPLNLGPGAPSSQRDECTKIRALPWETSGDEVSPLQGLPCCALIFLRTYPAVLTLLCSYFSSHLPCCALILFSLTLLYPSFYFHLPCYAFILFSLTLLCASFYFHLPCCALNFIFAYPAVRLFYFHLPCCALILFSRNKKRQNRQQLAHGGTGFSLYRYRIFFPM